MAIPLTSSLITVPPRILFDGGGGSGALAEAVVSDAGVITGVTVTNGGSGYTSAPTVSVLGGGGSGGTATASVSGGAVTSVSVTNGGTSYDQGAPGVLAMDVVNPFYSTASVLAIVRGPTAATQVETPINPAYIVDGQTAYWTAMHLQSDGIMPFRLGPAVDEHGTEEGPQFTDEARNSIYIVVFYGSSSAVWDFSVLDNTDPTEPHVFSASSVSAAGPANTNTLRTAIDADTTVKVMLVDGDHPSINIDDLTYEAPAGTSLDSPFVTSSTPGILVKGQVNPGIVSDYLQIVAASTSADRRITDAIDPLYIDGGATAYITTLSFHLADGMALNLHTSASSGGSTASLQFTESAEDSIWVILYYGDTSAAWEFRELDSSDETNPYRFSLSSVDSAGPAYTTALRDAINADSTVTVVLADSSHPGIDIDNLQYTAEEENGASLFDSSVSGSTPGVAIKTNQTRRTLSSSAVDINQFGTVNADYMEDGNSAIIRQFALNLNGGIRLNFSTSTASDVARSLSSAAESNLGIIARFVYTNTSDEDHHRITKWRIGDLVSQDGVDAYDWSNPSAGGPQINQDLFEAARDAATWDFLLVDTTHDNINWNHLRTDPSTAPATPTAPTVTSVGTTSISVTLSADPASDNAITSRDIRWKRTADGDTAWTEVTGITSPHSVTGLTAETEYEVQWRAISNAGTGEWSPSGTATTDTADLMPSIDAIADIELEHGGTLSVTLQDPGGDIPVTLEVTGRPSWVQFDPVSRELTGTAPNMHSSTELVYRATDTDGDTATRSFNVNVLLGLADSPAMQQSLGIDVIGMFTPGTGQSETIWSRPPRGTVGTLHNVDGTDLSYGVGDNPINRVSYQSSRNRLQLRTNDQDVNMGDYFGTGNDGSDLVVYFTTASGDIDFPATTLSAGSSWANISVPSEDRSFVQNLINGSGRLVMAFARANTAPTITFTTASSTVAGESVTTISGTVDDAEDDNATLNVTLSTTLGTLSAVTRSGSTWSATLTAPAATDSTQTMTVTATVTDSDGATASVDRSWTVSPSTGNPPTITFTTASSTVAGGSATTISGTVSDTEDDNATLNVTLSTTLGTLSAVIRSGSTWSATLSAPAATTSTQTMTVTATVTDSDSNTATATRSWTINGVEPEILTQVFDLSSMSSSGLWTGSVLIEPDFVNGGGTAYLRRVEFVGTRSIKLETSSSSSGSSGSDGPDLTSAVENYVDALTFTGDGGTFTIPGPNHNSNDFRDNSEPYFWSAPSSFSIPLWADNGDPNLTLEITDGVTPANESPTVTFTTATAIVEGLSVTNIAGTVNDTEDDNATLNVTLSTTLGTLSTVTRSGSTWSATLTAPAVTTNQQSMVVTATVTDSMGAVGTATRTWTVRANQVPTLTLDQSDQTVAANTNTTITATTTAPETGQTVTVTWSVPDGGSLSDTTGDTTTFTSPAAGASDATYRVVATATDNVGGVTTSTITFTVVAGDPPTITFTTATAIVEGLSVTNIAGTVNDTEDDNATLNVTLSTTLGTLSTVTRSGSTWSATLTAPAVTDSQQPMTVTATVTDSVSLTGTATRTWTVRANQSPTISLDQSDQELGGNANITIVSTTTAPETGQTVTVTWQALDGGSLSTLQGVSTVFTAPPEADTERTYRVRATVTDAVGATATTIVTFTVPQSATPVITFSTASAIVEGLSVTNIAGTVSDDEDSPGSLNVVLSTTLGTLSAVTRSGSTWSATLTAPVVTDSQQTMTITATVTDSANLSSSANRSWTVRANQDPTISLDQSDQNIARNGTLTINATTTSPESNQTVTVTWEVLDGGTLSATTGATTIFTAPEAAATTQTYRVRATATDTLGATADTTITLTVAASDAPTIAFTTATAIVEGLSVTNIAGTVNDTEDDNATLNVTLATTLGTLSAVTRSGSTWSAMLTAPAVTTSQQTMTITATVTDSVGLTGTATRTWTVRTNQVPTVSLNQSDQNINAGATVNITATTTAPESNQTVTVTWDAPDGGTVSPSTGTTTTFTAPTGQSLTTTYRVRATATDNLGGNSTATVSFTVIVYHNPVIDFTTAAAIVNGLSTTTISGTVSDVEDDDATLSVTLSTTLGTLSAVTRSGSTWSATLTAPAVTASQQSMVVTATVTDSHTQTGTDTRTWTVRANQAPTITLNRPDQDLTPGSTINITATTTAPETGQTVNVAWSAPDGGTVSPSSGSTTTFTAPTGQATTTSYRVRATATDNLGGTVTATVTFTVVVLNAPTITFTTAAADVEGGSVTTIMGTVSDVEDDNASLAVTLSTTLGTLSAVVRSGNQWSATLTAPGASVIDLSMTVTATVTDSDGLFQTSIRSWVVVGEDTEIAPTITLRLYDSTRSISLQSDGITIYSPNAKSNWFMAPNTVNAQSLIPYSVVDGPSVAERTRGFLEEGMPLWIYGHTNYDDIKQAINEIELLIERANNEKDVWIEYDDNRGDDNLWRSPIVSGTLAMTNQTLLYLRQSKAAMFAAITRQPWWEGAERAVNLASHTITNGGAISILSDNEGVVAAPIKITITKSGGVSSSGVRIYLFKKNNTAASVQNYNFGSTSGQTFDDTSREAVTRMATVNISALQEGWYRVWLGGASASSMDILRTSSVWRWAVGDANRYVDVGTWTPPGRIGSHKSRYTDLGRIWVGRRTHLHIHSWAMQNHVSPSQNVYLLPANGYREIYVAGSFPNSGTLVDNGIDKTVEGTQAAKARVTGEPLFMTPGEYSEITALTEDSSGAVSGTYTISARHKPRRSTL